MREDSRDEITPILDAARDGDPAVAERLMLLVYDELRKLAHHHMANEPPGLTLTATALVHEAYVRLVGDEEVKWDGRGHFFAAAARAMRRILIERARRQARLRKVGDLDDFAMGEVAVISDTPPLRLLALDEALIRLEQRDPRKGEVVNLRYFAGLTVDETARVLDISPRTVNDEWAFARAWLKRDLGGADD